jgi:hypothetical protein
MFSHYFWDYASRTPFYTKIKQIKRKNFTKNIKKYLRQMAGYIKFGGLKPIFSIFMDTLSSIKGKR